MSPFPNAIAAVLTATIATIAIGATPPPSQPGPKVTQPMPAQGGFPECYCAATMLISIDPNLCFPTITFIDNPQAGDAPCDVGEEECVYAHNFCTLSATLTILPNALGNPVTREMDLVAGCGFSSSISIDCVPMVPMQGAPNKHEIKLKCKNCTDTF